MRSRRYGGFLALTLLCTACQTAAVSPPGPAPGASASAPTGSPVATLPSVSPSLGPSRSASPTDYDALLYGSHYAPATGVAGGKVVVSEWQAADQLNPWYSNSLTDYEVLAATMRTLLRVSSDGHYEPDLAAAPITYRDSVTKDATGGGFAVHVTLKPGLRWSDGVPMTLEDLRYTWTWVNDPAQAGITTAGFELIDRIDVSSGGLAADVHFKQAYAGWLAAIGTNHILPEHYMRGIPVKDAASKSYPVSARLGSAPTIGPFKYVTAGSDTVELTRDPHWAGPAPACAGRPCLDRVTFKYYPGNKAGEIAAFLAGDVDVALALVQTDYDAIKGVDASVGRAIISPGWQYEHVDMNEAGLGPGAGHPALRDVVVRRAIEQAIDKQALWRTTFPGSPPPADDPCTNATSTAFWRLPGATCPPFDVAAANAALDAAGYARGPDGIRRDPTSRSPLVLVNCTLTDTTHETTAEFLARSLEAIGVRLDLQYVDGNSVLFAAWGDASPTTKCNLERGTYDLAEFTYAVSLDLYGDYYYAYDSEQIPTEANKGNGYNTLRLADPAMDAAIGALGGAIGPADQLAAVYRIQQVYIERAPEIVLYYRNEVRGLSAGLRGFEKNPSTATDLWNIEDWWLQP